MANTDGGVFGYGGVYADIAYGNVIVTPFGGFGGYRRNDSSGLGGVFQFRLSLGISYVFPNRHRIGLNFAHISNAAIHDKNPGEEEFYVTYAIPFLIQAPGRERTLASRPNVAEREQPID